MMIWERAWVDDNHALGMEPWRHIRLEHSLIWAWQHINRLIDEPTTSYCMQVVTRHQRGVSSNRNMMST